MILDHLEPIELSEESASAHTNELRSLGYLSQGMTFLSSQMTRIEQRALEQTPDKQVFAFGNVPGYEWVPLGLMACSFHWYAVSACNYVRMVGWLGSDGDPKSATEYVKRVIPSVYVWRNKVGAHFAITKPEKNDSPADLAASVMFPIAFSDDAFITSPFILAMSGGGASSASRDDMNWSLTKTHAELGERYWPEAQTSAVTNEESFAT